MQYVNHLKPQILTHIRKRFGDQLYAIVLFGSRIRQTSKAFSDIDLLIILDNLPKEQRKRRQLAASLRRELALPVDITLMSPAIFISSVQNCIPLMIELACAYEIWFEKDNFFSDHIQFVQSLMQQKKLIQLQPGVWKLTEEVDEMAADGIVSKAQALEDEGTLSEYPMWDPTTDSILSPQDEYDKDTAEKFYDDAHWIFHQIAVFLKHTYHMTLPDK